MADQVLDNVQLEAAIAEFIQDRQKEKYAGVMEILEKSMVLVPVMQLQGVDEETQKQMQKNRFVQLPKETRIQPCLLRKDTGEQALPIFSSPEQIPPDKKSTGLVAMPFQVCLSMLMSNQGHVENIALNPFTHNIGIPKTILEVAVKRRDMMQNAQPIKVSGKQFRQMVHNRMALYLLPQYLFKYKEEGLKELQGREGELLLQFYKESYPEERKDAVRDISGNFSVMTMNITEDMQITRVDMPNETNKKGMCYRVYVVHLRRTQDMLYYTLEKTEHGNYIGMVTADGTHELVKPVPDNGAEIEAIMNLAAHI